MISLPVLIGLAGFELHGFPANAADWGSWFRGHRGVGDVGHELVFLANHQIAQETDAQMGSGGGMCQRPLKTSTERDASICCIPHFLSAPGEALRIASLRRGQFPHTRK